MVAEDRQAGLRRHRQLVGLALRRRRAADRAGSECGRIDRLHQEEHHRQPELLDRAARGGAEAAARRTRRSSASSSRPISRCRAPARRHGRAVQRRPARLRRRSGRGEEVHQAHRLQRHPAHRCVHGRRLHRRKSGRWWPRPRRSRSEDQADRDLRARAGVHRPLGSREHRVREADHRRRGARHPARGAGHAWSSTSARTAATSRRSKRRRGRDLHLAHPRGRDRRERPRTSGASRTTCARARR
jgi:hypothetical protein